MGGQSFKCPLCKDEEWWCISIGQLRDHLNDKHEMKRVEFGAIVGNCVTVLKFEPVDKR